MIDKMELHSIRLRGPWHYRALDACRSGTLAVPGFLHESSLGDHQGPVALTRRFNWVARRDPGERVYLHIDRCAGRAAVSLNGCSVGTCNDPWRVFAFDVTDQLGVHNELAMELAASSSEGGTFARPVRGILGGVRLAVRSTALQVRSVFLSAGYRSAAGLIGIRGEYRATANHGPPVQFEVELAGRSIAELQRDNRAEWTAFELDIPVGKVKPWQPGGQTDPLYPLALRVKAGDIALHEEWEIGFRSFAIGADGRWHCNGNPVAVGPIVDVSADQTHGLVTWSWDGSWPARLVGHFAPDAFYQRGDREGFLVVQDVPILPTDTFSGLIESLARRSAHPSIAAWRFTALGDIAGHVADRLRRLDPNRPALSP